MNQAREEEILYSIALTRMTGFNFTTALHLYRELGGAKAIYDHRSDIADMIPDCSPRLVEALKNWNEALQRAEAEVKFIDRFGIQALTLNDENYPARLRECVDAPIIIYYKGTADLNQKYIVSIVGTRQCTSYGRDLIRRFVAELKLLCPQVLIVSGLAYGADINAHRNALEQGFETVGVLAHGMDQIYPQQHQQTARDMCRQGGLLTEYISQTPIDRSNFVKRNRIVAGMADATILVESAAKGGGLITCEMAQGYGRQVFAFPGPVHAPYSEGCNNLIRDNGAGLISSATDFVQAMEWQTEAQLMQAKADGIERNLFPDLDDEQRAIVKVLDETGDMQQNMLAVKTNIPIGRLTATLFQLEMKGVVKTLAGGNIHLLR